MLGLSRVAKEEGEVNTSSFELLTKGAHVTINGFFKPDEYTDAEGVKHNRIILVATHIYETPEKAE